MTKTTKTTNPTEITSFNAATCKRIKPTIVDALNEALAKFGLTAEIQGGRYDDETYKPKVIIVAGGGNADQANFNKVCHLFDLTEEDYGKEITMRGDTYKLIDLATRSPKFPIIMERKSDGQKLKFGEDILKHLKVENLGNGSN